AAAGLLSVEATTAPVRSDAEIEDAITSLGQERGGLVATPDVFMNVHRGSVIAHSIRNKVPAIFDGFGFASDGGLLEYGPNLSDRNRRVAYYVDRILRGTKPSDLPVELPTTYRFVINLKTARAIGLDIAADTISIANEVIE